jgi:hypothetical protein
MDAAVLADFRLLFAREPRPLSPARLQLLTAAESSLSLRAWALLRQGQDSDDLPAFFAAQGLDRVLGEILGDPAAPALYWLLWRHRDELANAPLAELLPHLCAEPALRATLSWHVWEGKSYVDQGAFNVLLQRLEEILVFELTAESARSQSKIKELHTALAALAEKAQQSAYQVEKFCDFE